MAGHNNVAAAWRAAVTCAATGWCARRCQQEGSPLARLGIAPGRGPYRGRWREHYAALYQLMRWVDDRVDHRNRAGCAGPGRRLAVVRFRRVIAALERGGTTGRAFGLGPFGVVLQRSSSNPTFVLDLRRFAAAMACDALDQANRDERSFERYADAVSGVPARLLWDLLTVPGRGKQVPVQRRARSHATILGRYCYHAHLARDLVEDAAADRIKMPLDFVHDQGGVSTPTGLAAVRRAWLARPAGALAPAIFNLARLHRGAAMAVLAVLSPYHATIQSGG